MTSYYICMMYLYPIPPNRIPSHLKHKPLKIVRDIVKCIYIYALICNKSQTVSHYFWGLIAFTIS